MARLSKRVADLHGSAVRAMLEAAQRPEVISFAGGLPSPDSFADVVIPAPPPDMLQYGPSEGEPTLRRLIAAELQALGLDCPAERVLVLSGSQQGIDLVAKLFVDAGTRVAVERPAYLAALQVFRFFGAAFESIDEREPGAGWTARDHPALAYVTPTFQNPTGRCSSAEQRRALAAACDETGVCLFEDDPYRDLAYDPCERRPIAADVRRAAWVYQGSFSKTLAPGLRLGFLAASEDLFTHLLRLKQAADLHTSRLSQWIVQAYLEDPARPARLARLVDSYRAKRDRFAAMMTQHLGNHATWTVPPGGLFFWADLAPGTDADALLEAALARDVLFTPGRHFLAAPDARLQAMRLNFSHADPAAAERGLAVLAELLRGGAGLKPVQP
jgi:DNA-binding transcriptional MocR family regulator